MKVHPQYITQKGLKSFVVLPYEEYERILNKLDDIEDIQAIEQSQQDPHKRFPLSLIEEIATGKNAIKAYREHQGISQAKLASLVNVSRQYMSQLESGERTGATRTLKRIAKILHVDLSDIV